MRAAVWRVQVPTDFGPAAAAVFSAFEGAEIDWARLDALLAGNG